jgi:hypothetical protein
LELVRREEDSEEAVVREVVVREVVVVVDVEEVVEVIRTRMNGFL